MEFRSSFSRLKKKVKHRLAGKNPKPKKMGGDTDGESVDSTVSCPASEPHVVAGGSCDQEGEEPNTGGGQALSTIRLSQPDEQGSMPECGSADNQGNRGADVDRGDVEQTHSHLHSANVEVAEGSGPVKGKSVDGEKVERVYPSQSITSIPHDGKPDGT